MNASKTVNGLRTQRNARSDTGMTNMSYRGTEWVDSFKSWWWYWWWYSMFRPMIRECVVGRLWSVHKYGYVWIGQGITGDDRKRQGRRQLPTCDKMEYKDSEESYTDCVHIWQSRTRWNMTGQGKTGQLSRLVQQWHLKLVIGRWRVRILAGKSTALTGVLVVFLISSGHRKVPWFD